MNTLEINKILYRNPITSPYYIGCYASNQIPSHEKTYPHCMVVNLDPSPSSGSHWIALYSETPGQVEYFDSFGLWPPPSTQIRDYFSKNYSRITYQMNSLQAMWSNACGMHVIFFLYHRCAGLSLDEIMGFLEECGPRHADTVVSQFVHTLTHAL